MKWDVINLTSFKIAKHLAAGNPLEPITTTLYGKLYTGNTVNSRNYNYSNNVKDWAIRSVLSKSDAN